MEPSKDVMIKEISENIFGGRSVCRRCGSSLPNPVGECICSYNAQSFEKVYTPVMIGDVLSKLEKNDECFNDWKGVMIPSNFPNMENQSRYGQLSKNGKMIVELFDLWKDKGLPIKSQSDKCIKFVYTILPNN